MIVSHPNGSIHVGDCIDSMRAMPDQSVHCVVTSPPYWGLRDYNVDGQIGLEDTLDGFVAKMVEVFQEVKRVLRDDGTLWLNLGDSYAGGGRGGNPEESHFRKQATNAGSLVPRSPLCGYKPKDLCGVPWRVAFALQADGWYLRQDIIWHKPNPMPESCRDRCTKSHEYVFLLTKSPRYYYDQEAISEPAEVLNDRIKNGKRLVYGGNKAEGYGTRLHSAKQATESKSRNKRDVWTISTESFPGSHFATFPRKLVEPCILAGCPEQCCPNCGKPWKRIVEKVRRPTRPGENTKIKTPDGWGTGDGTHGKIHRNGREKGQYRDSAEVGNRDPQRHVTETVTTGWTYGCACGPMKAVPGTVLDPFGGSGTTGQVAKDLGRRFVLCELNPEYVKLIKQRIEQPALF